jgi:hypothetical protein
MTELSGNFLLSRNLQARVASQATVNSAMELALSRLGTTAISAGCPGAGPVALNGLTAVTSFRECEPVADSGSPPFTQIASSSPFNVDGTHAVLGASGVNDYLVGDAGGNVFDYAFGHTSGWRVALGGSIQAPPTAITDPSGPPDVSTLVPVNGPTAGSGCTSQRCVALLSGQPGSAPSLKCYMVAAATVSASPAQGRNFPSVVYFGDGNGDLYAFDPTEDGACAQSAAITSSSGPGIVAGPVVFPSGSSSDAIYAIASDGSSSRLIRYTYNGGGGGDLDQATTLALPAASVQGIALDQTGLPARMAITFAGGTVAIVQINTNFSMSLQSSVNLGTSIADAPYWCHCPGGADVIGVGGQNGSLYLLDSSLNTLATLPAGGPAIATTPQSDGVGDWFFGGSDGYLYEAQRGLVSSNIDVVHRYGPFAGAIGSGTQVGACAAGLCVYLGSVNNAAYVVRLDARDAVITACLSTAPPACSGVNPRLWASVQVGETGRLQTVHIEGWSYYSP